MLHFMEAYANALTVAQSSVSHQKPSFIIFLRGNDLGRALRSWKE